jgi:hypothetical protein
MPQPSAHRRFWTMLAAIIALAFLLIAGLQIAGLVRDHERGGPSAPVQAA